MTEHGDDCSGNICPDWHAVQKNGVITSSPKSGLLNPKELRSHQLSIIADRRCDGRVDNFEAAGEGDRFVKDGMQKPYPQLISVQMNFEYMTDRWYSKLKTRSVPVECTTK